ncbi:hypothetical protein ACFQJ5_19465 [Halomicroarcula sp. GCM10025324]|uniref:hypothetical protein n=1 Tax=Halomicroarcula sp. GCM10025324 TaxID=3252667 RepID=UPI0036080110
MPSTKIERPEDGLRVAKRYLRRERLLSGLVIVVVVSLFLLTYVTMSLLPAIVVAAVLIIIARAPILQSKGTVRLQTDTEFETVVDAFIGPTPPVLALQWGVADEVIIKDETPTYPTSYLLGLRSAEPSVHTRTVTTPNEAQQVELEILVNDKPWATYTARIRNADEQTTIDVEHTSNRRFGLRRVPQQLLAKRYRDAAIMAQGFTVVERDAHFGL